MLKSDSSMGRVLQFSLPQVPVARVLHQVRVTSTPTRTELSRALSYSQPSITRHIAALTEAGLIEDKAPSHEVLATGRPRVQLGLDGRHLVFWGAHMGVRSSVLVIVDGAGRILRHQTLPLKIQEIAAEEALTTLAQALRELSAGLPEPANVGVSFSAHVDVTGQITSTIYRWENVPAATILAQACGRPVDVATGVTAMAATELLAHPLNAHVDDNSSTLYFYAREVVAHAWMFRGGVHRPNSGRTPGYLTDVARRADFPAVDLPNHVHRLSNTAVVSAARHAGVPAENFAEVLSYADPCSPARKILDQRADLLGHALSLAIDVVDPDSVVLAGDAFTLDPISLQRAVAVVHAEHGRGAALRIQPARQDILRDTARLVALYQFWQDPLTL